MHVVDSFAAQSQFVFTVWSRINICPTRSFHFYFAFQDGPFDEEEAFRPYTNFYENTWVNQIPILNNYHLKIIRFVVNTGKARKAKKRVSKKGKKKSSKKKVAKAAPKAKST